MNDKTPDPAIQELQALYQSLLGTPPPFRSSRRFLQSNIAWATQAAEANISSSALRKSLIAAFNPKRLSPKRTFKPGSQLIREWEGNVYEVTVMENGFRWRDQLYQSLSPIARDITGTRWSGPRFFGLVSS